MTGTRHTAIVIGAGIGGLAAALRLSAAGMDVTVLETADAPGGKMRVASSTAGPIDQGPTVLTFKHVFDALFADVGERIEDHLHLTQLPIIARHFWDDGTEMDLWADRTQSAEAVDAAFGSKARAEFERFMARAHRLLETFEDPMLMSGSPRQSDMVRTVLRKPSTILDMAPWHSLGSLLDRAFSEPKLAQLFARYATYVGGRPHSSPALLSLIAAGEANGVWAIKGGMHQLALSLQQLAEARGTTFLFGTPARRIALQGGRQAGVETDDAWLKADVIVFNGDPRALSTGLLGPGVTGAVAQDATEPRSLSADVLAFAARPTGPDIAYHNVFFSSAPNAEFPDLAQGKTPLDATLYLCAQDRSGPSPAGPERFEVIRNAPPDPDRQMETEECQTQIFQRFRDFGLTFDPMPGNEAHTDPAGLQRLFPASMGSIYGRSPHGLTAGLKRPTARTKIPGLYLAGGGAHPGAGVPMATLSALHAAEAIKTDLSLISTCRQTDTHGGTSTVSAPAGPAPSASSHS